MTVAPDVVEFTTDPQLLGLAISPAQETLLRGIYGLPLSAAQLELWRLCTGRETYEGRPFGEVTVLAGARAGKDSRIAAPIVCYEALFGGHETHLARGERAVIPLVAQDQRATKVAFGYVKDYLTSSPVLRSMLAGDPLALEIPLSNHVTIACYPCTLKSLRGWSMPAGVIDEVAFFRLEGQADSDVEVQRSIRRGGVNFPNPRLVKISTPYMKSGVLHDDFKRAFGRSDPDLLVWRATSLLMNPSLGAERLERERRLDPSRFAREYEAEFAEDLETFLPAAWVEAAVLRGCYELPSTGHEYFAAIDPSGGGADAFTLSIVHVTGEGETRQVVQDVIKGWRSSRSSTVDLEGIVKDAARILKAYDVGSVVSDRYAGAWVRQALERNGIACEDPPFDRSGAYVETEPLFAQGRIAILDHPQQERELKNLERRPRPGGRVVVDHPHGGHDDYANALALAAAVAIAKKTRRRMVFIC